MPQFSGSNGAPQDAAGLADFRIVFLNNFGGMFLSRFSNHCAQPTVTLET